MFLRSLFLPLLTSFLTHPLFQILDDFIDEAYEGWFDLVGDIVSGASPCILQTTDLDSVTHGSRKPMPNFESPFLNKTDNEIREWMMKHRHPNFVESTFTILDQNTIEHRICRIGYVSENYPDDQMLWSDFYANLYVRVPIKMGTVGWDELLLGPGEVYNRKVIAEEMKAMG